MQNILVYIVLAIAIIYSIVAIVRAVKRMNSSRCPNSDCDKCDCKNNDESGCGGCS